MNLGKGELLGWLNGVMQTDYMSMQGLSDGVAYAQVLDAVHPGCVSLGRLNLMTKYPEDNLRNLRLVEDAVKKLKIAQPASFEKMARGNFQDHIIFLQWLYGYANRNGADNLRYYAGFSKRQRILEKQGRSLGEMGPHLMPKQGYVQGEGEWEAGVEAEERVEEVVQVGERLGKVDEFVRGLENDLRQLMELNWKMMFNIDRSIEERNSLHNLLENIDRIVQDTNESPLKQRLQTILREMPPEYE